MRTLIRWVMATAVLGAASSAAEADPHKLFATHCAACHITDLTRMNDKSRFVAPPVDEVMTHIKEDFTAKEKAVKFMAEYVLAPDPKKSHCASIETFGLMPSQKGLITPEEATAITGMMYDQYPRKAFTEQENRGESKHQGMTFEKLDQNGDGAITAREFQRFRARKNNIDPSKFVNTYYFDRLDLNGDGKMDRSEFNTMKTEKRKKKRRSL